MFKKIIIFLFVTSLLSSTISWASLGTPKESDSNKESNAEYIDTSTSHTTHFSKLDNNVMHHLVDEHHDDHDCHMAAHLIGLNSNSITIAHYSAPQIYHSLNVLFSSQKTTPPNKPPRA